MRNFLNNASYIEFMHAKFSMRNENFFERPPSSPDFNPIEQVFGRMS